MREPPMLSVAEPDPAWRRPGALALGICVALAGVLSLLYFHRPEGQYFFPRCSFHAATGLLCPGCGGLRATHALLHGDLGVALRSNALLVAGLPVALGYWFRRRRGLHPAGLTSRVIWTLFAVVVAYSVLRNLPIPAARWLSP